MHVPARSAALPRARPRGPLPPADPQEIHVRRAPDRRVHWGGAPAWGRRAPLLGASVTPRAHALLARVQTCSSCTRRFYALEGVARCVARALHVRLGEIWIGLWTSPPPCATPPNAPPFFPRAPCGVGRVETARRSTPRLACSVGGRWAPYDERVPHAVPSRGGQNGGGGGRSSCGI